MQIATNRNQSANSFLSKTNVRLGVHNHGNAAARYVNMKVSFWAYEKFNNSEFQVITH